MILLVAVVLSVAIPALIFVLDLLWRLVIIVLDIASWYLFTPPIAVPYGIGRLFGWIKPTKEPQED